MFFELNPKTKKPEPTTKATKAEMFTLSTNSWKQLHWGLDDRLLFPVADGLFSANCFHFIAYRRENLERTIVCFDIQTETFKIMDLPSNGPDKLFTHLMVFDGCLSAVCVS